MIKIGFIGILFGMKTLLFGGTFDPPHNGHTGMLAKASKMFDRVIVMPGKRPPHKDVSSDAAHRLAMCRLAFTDCEVSDFEMRQEGVSYTYKTLREFSNGELYFLLGSDSMLDIFSWKNVAEIASLCTLYVVRRPGYTDGLDEVIERYQDRFGGRVMIAEYKAADISSSRIRVLRAFDEIGKRVPKSVAEYIYNNGLYHEYADISDKFGKFLLTQSRIEHIKNTTLTALDMAKRFGADQNKVIIACMLHDIAKSYTAENLRKVYGKYVPKDCPDKVVHSFSGRQIAEEDFGITDGEILRAIETHTAGEPAMTDVQKIVFIADFIEPGRDFRSVKAIRTAAKRSLDEAVYQITRDSIDYLAEKKRAIYPLTYKTYEYYKKIYENGDKDGKDN